MKTSADFFFCRFQFIVLFSVLCFEKFAQSTCWCQRFIHSLLNLHTLIAAECFCEISGLVPNYQVASLRLG